MPTSQARNRTPSRRPKLSGQSHLKSAHFNTDPRYRYLAQSHTNITLVASNLLISYWTSTTLILTLQLWCDHKSWCAVQLEWLLQIMAPPSTKNKEGKLKRLEIDSPITGRWPYKTHTFLLQDLLSLKIFAQLTAISGRSNITL